MSGMDQRIAYGATCTWWGSISEVGSKPSGLPCCPKCGGVLMEAEDMDAWLAGARKTGRDHDIDYVTALMWCRHRCNRQAGVDLGSLPDGAEPPIYRWWSRDVGTS